VGDDLKVVARLVDADGGTIGHQEAITDRFANVLNIEEQLARRFAAALEHSSAAAVRTVRTSSVDAYRAVAEANDLYLNGRFAEAVERLESATSKDPSYAEAWALLGKSYAQRSAPSNLDRNTRSEFMDRALQASQHAVELDNTLYDAHVALAATYQQLEQVESWRITAEKAIWLNPRLADAYVILGDSYGASPAFGCSRKRDLQLAESYYRTALKLNPSFGLAHVRLSSTLQWSGREADSLRQVDEALHEMPTNLALLRARAAALTWLGRTEELAQQLRNNSAIGTTGIVDQWMVGAVSVLRGDAETAAAQFKPVIESGPAIVREIDTGRIYAQAGRMKEAAGHLRHALALDASCAAFISENPGFAKYRSAPEFKDLLKK
jgi:tetratricopeptide (TPR) repeat protein